MAEAKKLFIKTYGCQMNVYDSERMAEALAASGYEQTDRQDEADMILLNTCHIREKAAEKVYSELGRLRPLKTAKPDLKIGVAGCVAQAEGAEILSRQPMVDLVVGPQSYHRLPALVEAAQAGRKALDTDFPDEDKFDHLARRPATRRAPSAFLTVQEGCDKFCAFCVVPYTRGAEASRRLDAIVEEARQLVDGGAREITLLGQNVNAWADGNKGFGQLVEAIAALPGVERIRYTTSHPRDVTEAMIRAHADIPQLMPYLHLPVQSGSDRVLAAMNRKHDRAFYFGLIDRFRAVRPDLAITSDFIVGFPGETEEDFADTLSLVEQVGYAQAFSFKYSPRLGTPAAERDDQIDEDVKSERLHRLQALLQDQSLAFNRRSVGQSCDILIERRGRQPGQWIGKSPWLQSVVVTDPTLSVGDLVRAELVSAGPNSLEGRLLTMKTAA